MDFLLFLSPTCPLIVNNISLKNMLFYRKRDHSTKQEENYKLPAASARLLSLEGMINNLLVVYPSITECGEESEKASFLGLRTKTNVGVKKLHL